MTEFRRTFESAENTIGISDVALLSSAEDWMRLGLNGDDLNLACLQVSQMVAQYVAGHENEMLLKDPNTVKEQFLRGDSVLMVKKDNTALQVVGHGTNYINFEDGEDLILGAQVTEVGTVIVRKDFRGLGCGKAGVKHLAGMALNGYQNVLRLATIKQAVTGRVFENAGIVPVSFYNYPYLSYLTCTCSNSSERCGHASCQFRRTNDSVEAGDFDIMLDPVNNVGKIPCTLVLSDTELAGDFERRCRALHEQMGGNPLEPGQINPKIFENAGYFFEKINEIAKQN